MSEDMSSTKVKNAPCVKTCALHYKGHCSIKLIAQAQYNKHIKNHESTEEETTNNLLQQ